jgi:hypothetical protein
VGDEQKGCFVVPAQLDHRLDTYVVIADDGGDLSQHTWPIHDLKPQVPTGVDILERTKTPGSESNPWRNLCASE